ncbi:taurine ABC transporter permease TauC [Chromobacterium sp. Panama]|uniref:taurine ABC transporter permease TauC n=1 Tax=Chromobacterium sp. Panama TaxID=2161826 RepID=UPI000D31971F|nr:taurine ABC transporter permease TauC [Chromobacterium sp. Panama]PTU67536.1 taurine ABC transporter permease TauC [Chromobacterium sp. Panama]
MPPLELTELGPAAQAELSVPPPAHAHAPLSGRFAAWRRRWPSALSVGGLLLLWWAASAGGLVSPLFLPGPAQVAARLADLAVNGFMDASLWRHAAASLGRVGLALLLAAATAVPLGMLMGLSRRAHAALDPLIEFYRPVPPLAYLPLIVIWFGIGEASKVLLIYLAIFAPLAIATAAGVRRADPARLQAARSLGASRGQLLRLVVLPSALPEILTGLRIGLGVGWSTLVAAELVAATRGLGFMVQSAAQFLVTDAVIAGILIIAWIALALELGLRWAERRFAGWAAPERF